MILRIGVVLTMIWPLCAGADVLQMPADAGQRAEPARAPLQMELPARGLSMKAVAARFGEPESKIPPVGDPPISRWVYPDYTVYFEHQFVIHAVLNR